MRIVFDSVLALCTNIYQIYILCIDAWASRGWLGQTVADIPAVTLSRRTGPEFNSASGSSGYRGTESRKLTCFFLWNTVWKRPPRVGGVFDYTRWSSEQQSCWVRRPCRRRCCWLQHCWLVGCGRRLASAAVTAVGDGRFDNTRRRIMDDTLNP